MARVDSLEELFPFRLRLLALGDVTQNTGEKPAVSRLHLADGEFHRKDRAIFSSSHGFVSPRPDRLGQAS